MEDILGRNSGLASDTGLGALGRTNASGMWEH